jgi:endonuclease III-like uncharacterized protein
MTTQEKLQEALELLTRFYNKFDNWPTDDAAENIVIAAEIVAHQARVLQLELKENEL